LSTKISLWRSVSFHIVIHLQYIKLFNIISTCQIIQHYINNVSNYSTLYQQCIKLFNIISKLCVKLFHIVSIIYQIIQHYIYNVFKLFNITSGMYQIIQHSNKTSFNGYINNAMIKLPIHFNSSIHIARQIMDFIPKRLIVYIYIYRTIVHTIIKIWFVSLYYSFVSVIVFNTTFNNIKVISWRSVSLVEETRVLKKKKTPTCCEAMTNLYHITLYRCHERDSNLQL
jgi:hypothetical protein